MLISYQRGPRNNRRKGQVSAVRGAGGPLSGQGTDMPGRGDQHSPTAAAMFPGRQKMQLVLIKHAMVDSVPRAGPVPSTGPRDSGLDCWVAHDIHGDQSFLFSHRFSCSHIKSPWLPRRTCGLPVGRGSPVPSTNCPPPGQHHSHTQDAGGRRGCKSGMRIREERGVHL